MNSNKAKLTTATLASLSLFLTACGGGSGGGASASASAETNKNPVLSVPETTESKSITFKVDPGNAKAGQDYHVGVYGGGFGESASDCSEEIASMDGQFGDKQSSGTVQVKQPGEYQLVLSTEGHATECQNPNAKTTVKTKPQLFLDGNLNTDGAQTITTEPGKSFPVAVIMKGDMPDDATVPVELTVRGPYSTEPELRAARCEDDKIAAQQTVEWNGKDYNRANNRYTATDLTIEGTKGLYLVTAENEETEAVAKAETECDNYQSSLRVSTKGTNGKTDADVHDHSTPMSTEGTNALTGKNGGDEKKKEGEGK